MNNTIRIVGRLKVKHIYECFVCGAGSIGDAVSVKIDVRLAAEIPDLIKQMPLRPHSMPVGWTSSWDGFRHAACVPNKGEQ